MRIHDSIERRLNHLESAHGAHPAVLVSADGSRRAITFKHPLNVFCSAMALLAYYAPPGAAAEGGREHHFPDVPKHHVPLIRLIGNASSIETYGDVFLTHLHAMCAGVVDDERNLAEGGEVTE